MGYFTSSALAQSQSRQVNLDATWEDATWTFQWSNSSDSTRWATLYGSADEGTTWFQLGTADSGVNNGSPQFFANKPVNALKVSVLTAATGNTITSEVTGA